MAKPSKKPSRFRQALLMKSVISEQNRIDPAQFKNNLGERVKNVPVVGKLAQRVVGASSVEPVVEVEAKARKARETGEISLAIQILADSNSAPELRSFYEAELARLQQPFVRSLPISRVNRVLHFLTNSLPHTNSGYSLRSHSVLDSMNSVGITSCAVSRLGYPAVIGRFASSNPEHVDGISYYRMLPKTMPLTNEGQQETAIEELIRIARETGAEAIHTTTGFENALIASRAAMILEIPWVYEMRGEPERTWLSKKPANAQHIARNSEYFRLAHLQELEAAKNAAAVVVLSEITKASLIQRGIDENKIFVVPNGVSDDAFVQDASQSEMRQELGLPLDKKIVGAITAVVDYEGLEYFIEAIEKLDDSYVGLIVGDGVALAGLKEEASKRSLTSRIIFAGKQDNKEIQKWYKSLDVFVVPRKNTLVCQTVTPIKTVMAQAVNVPVVASDLPALREVTGGLEIYVAPEDPDALKEGIKAAIDAPNTNERVRWARDRRWSALGKVYGELYQAGKE